MTETNVQKLLPRRLVAAWIPTACKIIVISSCITVLYVSTYFTIREKNDLSLIINDPRIMVLYRINCIRPGTYKLSMKRKKRSKISNMCKSGLSDIISTLIATLLLLSFVNCELKNENIQLKIPSKSHLTQNRFTQASSYPNTNPNL